ncbi:MAG: hypothetical protein NC390_08610, partial [Fusobacterium sp.]|nr:hypothetical protein [Fusobacterium sp.]
PSLTGNINERTWNTQRKALYARFSQAIALMPALNGYGTLTGTISEDFTQTVTEDTAAETFITSGLSKVLKINNICDYEHLTDCGLPSKIYPINANSALELESIKHLSGFNNAFDFTDEYGISYHEQLLTKAAAFETANGESVLTYYLPTCRNDDSDSLTGKRAQRWMCANFVYDLNGNKGPNTVGKDIGFISVLYASDPVVVAPIPIVGNAIANVPFDEVASVCRNRDSETRVPNYEELASLFYNKILLGQEQSDLWSTRRYVTSNGGWLLKFRTGGYVAWNKPAEVRCIKR